MANQEQLSILKQGVDVWNTWRESNPFDEVDLSGADLSNEDLESANFRGVSPVLISNLKNIDFEKANLNGAMFDNGVNLEKANFKSAKLIEANFTEALLHYVNFNSADLAYVNFSRSLFLENDFQDAQLGRTTFEGSDLSKVKGLESTNHILPSNISMNVFTFSKGIIPETFLRGCGLSDTDIEYSKLLNPELSNEAIDEILRKIRDRRSGRSIQISPLFISYSHADGKFVDKLEVLLNEKGIRFWRDIHNMKSGRIETQIDRAIRENRMVLLILSEHSLQSDWVEHEVRTARALAKEIKRDVLCPVALDDSWKNSSWANRIMEQIMEYNILDFSNWKDDAKFEDTFNKLIDGLRLFY